MAAYAALLSLMNLIEQIQNQPPPPISLYPKQVEPRPSISLYPKQVESLVEKIAFLQDFLEAYNTCDGDQEVDRLRSRIADAAYAAEDVIESHIVDQIQARSNSTPDKNGMEKVKLSVKRIFGFFKNNETESDDVASFSSFWWLLYDGLQKVIRNMDSIKKDVMEIKDKVGSQDQLQRIITTPVVSSASPSTDQNNTMVGFDNVLYEILDKLTGQHSGRRIISISGMSGIGKTTLALNVYTNPLIEYRFDVFAWVTISQEYNICEILLEILLCLKNQGNKESLNQKSEEDLGLELHKCLSGRRYLIIMDDMWSVEVWDKTKFYFPDNNNASRIIITTRISKLARELDGTFGIEMSFLDGDKSWDLFRKIVFGKQACPDKLEQIGKKIAKNCKGLPLSIVMIGGLLAKSKQTMENWEYIAKNLNSVVNLDDNERCLRILRTSYSQLPIHLKPCFLYMGSFPEDAEINISKLVKQWVSEGFLRPSKTKILEEIAEEYLTDLIERNLILVSAREWSGKPIFCKIHDLLRDLCLREANKDKFLYVTNQHRLSIIPQDISTQRRIAILERTSNEGLDDLKSASLVRSLMIHFDEGLPSSLCFRLLRVFKTVSSVYRSYSTADIFQLINSRYLDVQSSSLRLSSSISLFWNLQTLIITNMWLHSIPQSEFWMMPQLRHVLVDNLHLPADPCSDQKDKQDDDVIQYLRMLSTEYNFKQDDGFVMENLQTLSTIYNLRLSEEVVKRIPNVKELKIHYQDNEVFEVASHYCLNNLDRLHKLEYLECSFFPIFGRKPYYFQNNMSFPNSLKELSLCRCSLDWENVNIKIGSLPFLQKLTLRDLHFTRSNWETVEGQFSSLKYLRMHMCSNLECWTVEYTHFPLLEHLNITALKELKEIPSEIGEIPTLKSIRLDRCSYSAAISAKRIAEEQEEIGNEDLQVRVTISLKESELTDTELVSSRNFHVKLLG